MMGEFGTCKMKVKITRCKTAVAANVVLEADNGVQKNFVIFDEQLRKIVSGDSSLSWEEKLLNYGKMKICISERHVIVSATAI